MSFTPPDWRDESNYPDPKETTSLHFWAWEFLRRNKDYQHTWDEYAARLRAIGQRLPKLNGYIERIVTDNFPAASMEREQEKNEAMDSLLSEQPEYFHLSPPAEPGESLAAWEARAGAVGGAFLRPMDSFLGEKWGLDRLVNPAARFSSDGFASVRFLNSGTALKFGATPVKGGMPRKDDPAHPLTGYLFSALFDLRLPDDVLRAQFNQVLEMKKRRIAASHFKPYSGRPEKSLPNFRNHLRTLDALAAGATVKEIAETILPHYSDTEDARKTVANWKTRAIKIRDVEYAHLPAHAVIGTKKKVKER